MIEDEELRNLYQISSVERLQQLEAGLRYLTLHPDDETTLKELRREVHGLRGDSRGVGVEAVETLAFCLEKILGSIQRQQVVLTPLLSDRLYQGLAAISLLVQESVTDQPSEVDTAQVLELLTAAISESQQAQQEAFPDAQAEQKVELAPQAFINNSAQAIVPIAVADINDNAPQSAPIFIEDEDLRDIYKITSEERLQKLETGLRYLTSHPNDQTTLEELQREAHSLTGDSRSAGVDTVEILARSLEEILDSIKHEQIVLTQEVSDCPRGTSVADRLYQGLAAINRLVQEAVTDQPSGVDISEVFDDWMEVVLEAQQLQQDAVPDAEEDKEDKEDNESSRSQPTIYDHTYQFITPTLEAELNGNTPQLPPTFIEDEDLRDIYKITSEERLQKLEAGLLHLEKHPDDETTLEELLREAHSLKGDSRSADLENVETLTHAFEEVVLSIKRQQTVLTQEVGDCLYQGLDAIALLVHEAVTGQHSNVDTAGVLEQLMAAVAAPTIPESLPVSPQTPSAKIPESTTQDLPTPLPEVGEPYRIDTIRVQTRELDALMSQSEELIVTKIRIAHATAAIEEMASLWDDWKAFYSRGQSRGSSSLRTNPYQERLENIINSLRSSTQEDSIRLDIIAGELRDKIRTLRLLPLSTVFQLFPRMVRDLARQQSKEVELIIEGGETTADKQILEEIKDSLMHMIRNAIDHGIETPAERERLGKSPVAKIWLRGYQTAHNIVIEVADDGRGLDIEKIKQTAVKRKLYRKEELETMSSSQIYDLIFAPGFSTRTFITEISGRGIGLDVVRSNVERLKGNSQIESTPGQGCTFRLQLRTTLATVNALLLEVQGIVMLYPLSLYKQLYWFPRSRRFLPPKVTRPLFGMIKLFRLRTSLMCWNYLTLLLMPSPQNLSQKPAICNLASA
jgi:two-component system chemotaxis sensor kinase CheA